MYYFYLKIAPFQDGISAQTGGIYRDDILKSLIPEGDFAVVLADLSAAGMQVLQQMKAGRKLGDKLFAIASRKKALEVIRLFGPTRSLSQEQAGIFVYAGELPEFVDTLNPGDACASIKFEGKRRSIIKVPDALRLHSMVGRALVKLMSRHLRRSQETKLRENMVEILQPVIEGVLAVAQGEGITINDFPGRLPGLCTLWFVKGIELDSQRRREFAANPPDSLDVGEITLTADWTSVLREKADSSPGLFSGYIRLEEGKTTATCGCLSLLVCSLIGIIPAAIYGGRWWYLPLGASGAALVFNLASQLVLDYKRRALYVRRRDKVL